MDSVAEVTVVDERACNWSVHIRRDLEFALDSINNCVRDCSETGVGRVDLRDRTD